IGFIGGNVWRPLFQLLEIGSSRELHFGDESCRRLVRRSRRALARVRGRNHRRAALAQATWRRGDHCMFCCAGRWLRALHCARHVLRAAWRRPPLEKNYIMRKPFDLIEMNRRLQSRKPTVLLLALAFALALLLPIAAHAQADDSKD